MTDRGEAALRQSETTLEIGPSKLHWDGARLVIDIDEISSLPIVGRVRGQVVVMPKGITGVELPLTDDGAHVWRPFAPTCDIAVNLEAPGGQWTGHGYFDANFGTRALEQDFRYWTWGRYPLHDGGDGRSGSVCFYDVDRRDGASLGVGIAFDGDNRPSVFPPPPKARLANSLWQVRRQTRADQGYTPRQVQNMLDAPFYSRSTVRTCINGQETEGVHEALDLNRFAAPLIKAMLAFRVPRRAGWRF